MEKKTKRTFKIFAAWDYDKEAEEYDKMSLKGWQLVSGGCFSQKYEFDDSVTYRYQLDFNNDITDMERYDETFRERGWERVNSTFNSWHIFRKPYDPSLPDEEYEIYTDTQSRNEMLKRWRNFAVFFIVATTLTSINPLSQVFDSYNTISSITVIALYLLMAIMYISGLVGINNLIKGKKNKHRFNFNLFLPLLIIDLLVFIVSLFADISTSIYYALGMLVGILIVAIAVIIGVFSRKNKENNNS